MMMRGTWLAALFVLAACVKEPPEQPPTEQPPVEEPPPEEPPPEEPPPEEPPPEEPPPEEPPPRSPVTLNYTNPLKGTLPAGGFLENCADPVVIRSQRPDDKHWYLYCTTDPLNDQDRDEAGNLRYHRIPTLRSMDLVEWEYIGDAFTTLPEYATSSAGLWAPEIAFFNDKYYLYYTVTETKQGGSAIGVATSTSPVGPWEHSATPVVAPHAPPCCVNDKRWVFDPEILDAGNGKRYIYYGSYFGGISVRELSEDGLTSNVQTQVEVTAANRYEAANVFKHKDFYYLLGSATNCCNGELTGYSVFAGRSLSPTGPFVDREGVPLTLDRVGGTPVLHQNGNRWVGAGHNSVVVDDAGRHWMFYHAIDRHRPFFAGRRDVKRPLLLDAVDWTPDDWPVVRGGLGPSDTEQPAPAAQAGQISRYTPTWAKDDAPGTTLTLEEFNGAALDASWAWRRPPAETGFRLGDGHFALDTQPKDVHQDSNDASILYRSAPQGDYLVEAKFSLNLPPSGCCHNYVQAGLLLFADDDRYVKLSHFSYWETRQVAFAKELPKTPEGLPRYGEMVGGPAAETLWIRIARRARGNEELYTAYSSRDGMLWSRAGTWTHTLGTEAKIGLFAMAGGGFTARFDYVKVSTLAE
jgi:arabinan endo-1,5-alpha-L-arabinosidase